MPTTTIYSLLIRGDKCGGVPKCNHCKDLINVKLELFIRVKNPNSLHGSSSTKFYHPECLPAGYPCAPDAVAFVNDILVDDTKSKYLEIAGNKDTVVQTMNKESRSVVVVAAQKPANTKKKLDMPALEPAIPIDNTFWKASWDNTHIDNVGIRGMLIDIIKCYAERAENGDAFTKVVSGAWAEFYVTVIDIIAGIKEGITVEAAKALPGTSNGDISEDVADCIATYISDGSNIIIANIKAADQKADEWKDSELEFVAVPQKTSDEGDQKTSDMGDVKSDAEGDQKTSDMGDVKSDDMEEQQLNDAIRLSQMEAGTDEDMEDVEGEVAVMDKAAEKMDDDKDEPKETEEDV